MDSYKTQVRQFIQDNFMLSGASAAFADDASFMEAQILDSTGFLELIAYLEETFSISVSDDEMIPENLDSLDAVAAYLGRKLGHAPAGQVQ